MIKGFTLLELTIVIVIIGILATLGFSQYSLVIEKGRSAEAKAVLGQIRSAQLAYNVDYGTYGAIQNLSVSAVTTCTATNYFSYAVTPATALGTATRCTSGGKTPTFSSAYSITVTYDTGTWSGNAGYF